MPDHTIQVGTRIVGVLERIAEALENPTPMRLDIHHTGDQTEPSPSAPPPPPTPKGSYTNNGFTHLYRHPASGWIIVARRDDLAESGYTVTVERDEHPRGQM